MQAHAADPHVSETPAASPLLPAATRPLAVDEFDPALGGPDEADE